MDDIPLPYERAKEIVVDELGVPTQEKVDFDSLTKAFRQFPSLVFDCCLYYPHKSALAASLAIEPTLELVKLLHKEDPDAIKKGGTFTHDTGLLPLHMACAMGASVKVIQYLVEQYPESIHTKTRDGLYPLHLACDNYPSLDPVEFLVTSYPDALIESKMVGCHVSYSVIESAIDSGCNPEVLEVLLQNFPLKDLKISLQGYSRATIHAPILAGEYEFTSLSYTSNEREIFPILLVSIAKNSTLNELSLCYDHDDIDDDDAFPAEGLEYCLRKNRTMQSLHLSSALMVLDEAMDNALVHGVSHNTTLEKLRLHNFSFLEEDKLPRLFTRNNTIKSYSFDMMTGESIASMIAVGMSVRHNVQELILTGCDLEELDVQSLLEVVETKPSLERLTLDLSGCEFESEQLEPLANLKQLRYLKFHWPYDEPDPAPLFELLRTTANLQELCLHNMSCVDSLAEALRHNHGMTSLELYEYEDYNECILEPIIELLEKYNFNITTVGLDPGMRDTMRKMSYLTGLNAAGRGVLFKAETTKDTFVELLVDSINEGKILYGLLREVPHLWSSQR